jgi:chaperonin GroEL
MAAKEVKFGKMPGSRMVRGVDTLANAVKVTLGPRGRNVVLDKSFGAPTSTKDGVSVAKEIELETSSRTWAPRWSRKSPRRPPISAGDGTTTATVLAQSFILREGMKAVDRRHEPDGSQARHRQGREGRGRHGKLSKPCNDDKSIAQVGTISANSDDEIGKSHRRCDGKVGKEGVITVEEGSGSRQRAGSGRRHAVRPRLPQPLLRQQPARACSAELDDPYILIHDKKISNIRDLLPGARGCGQVRQAAADRLRGQSKAKPWLPWWSTTSAASSRSAAVKAPGFGDRRKAMLQDLAVLTGGTR